MTDETSEAVAACISRDCQFVHDHTRETPEAPAMPDDAAMAAADAHAAEGYPAHGAAAATAVGWQRGWAAGYAAGREAAAQAVLDEAAALGWEDDALTTYADAARLARGGTASSTKAHDAAQAIEAKSKDLDFRLFAKHQFQSSRLWPDGTKPTAPNWNPGCTCGASHYYFEHPRHLAEVAAEYTAEIARGGR